MAFPVLLLPVMAFPVLLLPVMAFPVLLLPVMAFPMLLPVTGDNLSVGYCVVSSSVCRGRR